MSFRCIAMLEFVRTNQNPKENGGAKRRHSLWGFTAVFDQTNQEIL
jgi:hypothetical protein